MIGNTGETEKGLGLTPEGHHNITTCGYKYNSTPLEVQ